jgi:transcriptional regulator with XRE-family HTH domain
MEVSDMNTADRIQLLRRQKGLSQEQLADEIGVSRQLVSKWENEQAVPDMERIIILSDYFGTTTDYLLKGIEPAAEKEVQKKSSITERQIRSILLDVVLWLCFIGSGGYLMYIFSLARYVNQFQKNMASYGLSASQQLQAGQGLQWILKWHPYASFWYPAWILLCVSGALIIYRIIKRRKAAKSAAV